MEKAITVIATAFFLVLIIAGTSLIIAFPVQWCWNYAVVSIFGLPAITWGKAWCLLFLANMLIKSSISTGKGK